MDIQNVVKDALDIWKATRDASVERGVCSECLASVTNPDRVYLITGICEECRSKICPSEY